MPPKGSRVVKDDNQDSRSDGSSSNLKSGNARAGKRQGAAGAATTNGGSNLRDAMNANDASSAAQSNSGSNAVRFLTSPLHVLLSVLLADHGRCYRTQFSWPQEPLSLLHAYRSAHHLPTPSAFTNQRNQFLLSNPGIGKQSPTMCRNKQKRKVAKEQLALAVRKNFNAAAVSEVEVMVGLLYKVRHQGERGTPTHTHFLLGMRRGKEQELTWP